MGDKSPRFRMNNNYRVVVIYSLATVYALTHRINSREAPLKVRLEIPKSGKFERPFDEVLNGFCK